MATVATNSAQNEPIPADHRILLTEPNAVLRGLLEAFLRASGFSIEVQGESILLLAGDRNTAYNMAVAFRWGWRRHEDEVRTRLNELTA